LNKGNELMPTIKIELIDKECKPMRMREGDACFDLRSRENYLLKPGEVGLIPVGIKTEIPLGYHAAVSARSSMAKKGLLIANAPGIIDSYYRDEWKVLLYNSTTRTFKINKGDRIAQFRIVKNVDFVLEEIDKVSLQKNRGVVFGSTGLR